MKPASTVCKPSWTTWTVRENDHTQRNSLIFAEC
jgi:hypothetical protein